MGIDRNGRKRIAGFAIGVSTRRHRSSGVSMDGQCTEKLSWHVRQSVSQSQGCCQLSAWPLACLPARRLSTRVCVCGWPMFSIYCRYMRVVLSFANGCGIITGFHYVRRLLLSRGISTPAPTPPTSLLSFSPHSSLIYSLLLYSLCLLFSLTSIVLSCPSFSTHSSLFSPLS